MLDEDLAELYRVPTTRLNEQVKRNIARFPKDVMFQIATAEFENLKSQIASANWGDEEIRLLFLPSTVS
ncbi:MAG: ORF6N domain-containing protein [Bacteroidota bacterium]|nr:ORF6N domain-containing protein [Bacteroidota bacterium]MDP4212080.1 ORF6N domain-containing protein [Bacteroidota bacterium]MDP4249305.1 ORF6N domain-containing protein [Bacteroidota bacterium]